MDGHTLNQKRNISLVNIKGIINGDVNVTRMDMHNTNITIYGNLFGFTSFLQLKNTTLSIKGDGHYNNCSIYMDLLSSINMGGIFALEGTPILLDFNNQAPQKNEYIFISPVTFNSNVIVKNVLLQCGLTYHTTTSAQISVFFDSADGCSNGVDKNVIIGCVVGVTAVAVIIACYLVISRRKYLKKQLRHLRKPPNQSTP
eukprot:TRINITY_DN13699_c0_g1_i2.p1 TRINITY_DN13699_c0_g1~~TRINITY_DN13699_c0_g1_i2.p1  ORF type:complete len:210 (+),score=25.70 TRINITY_DN13699_c0_g1_i2:31-630(+)